MKKKCNHYFGNLRDDCKIDNVICDNCGMSYYQFLLKEISYWREDSRNARTELAELRENLQGIKWVDNCPSDKRYKFCPACGCIMGNSHDEDCWLAKMIGGE